MEIMEEKKANKVNIYRPGDVYDKMKYNFRIGKTKGTTTYNEDIDNAWKWRKGEANIWTGYANEGKSIFLKQLCMIKALEENWKFAFSSPEDFPPEDFFDDMVHTLAGYPTDKDSMSVISDETYEKAYDLIKNNFIFVYIHPPNNTIMGALESFRKLCKEEKIDGFAIDPAMKFARPKTMADTRDDIYASYVGSICMDFCRETETSFHLVMHQLTPTFEDFLSNGSSKKRYSEPSMYRVKGGGSWADGFDNVLSIWRPDYAFDKAGTAVQFSSQKIKKQKLVGIPQRINMAFDRKSNRFTEPSSDYPIFNFDKFMYEK